MAAQCRVLRGKLFFTRQLQGVFLCLKRHQHVFFMVETFMYCLRKFGVNFCLRNLLEQRRAGVSASPQKSGKITLSKQNSTAKAFKIHARNVFNAGCGFTRFCSKHSALRQQAYFIFWFLQTVFIFAARFSFLAKMGAIKPCACGKGDFGKAKRCLPRHNSIGRCGNLF